MAYTLTPTHRLSSSPRVVRAAACAAAENQKLPVAKTRSAPRSRHLAGHTTSSTITTYTIINTNTTIIISSTTTTTTLHLAEPTRAERAWPLAMAWNCTGSVEVQRCGGVEGWRCGGAEGGGVELWRCGGREVWRG